MGAVSRKPLCRDIRRLYIYIYKLSITTRIFIRKALVTDLDLRAYATPLNEKSVNVLLKEADSVL